MKPFEPFTLDEQFAHWRAGLLRSRQLALSQVAEDHAADEDQLRKLQCQLDLLRDKINDAWDRAANAYDREEPDWRSTSAGRRRFDRFARQRLAKKEALRVILERRIAALLRPLHRARHQIEEDCQRVLLVSTRKFNKLKRNEAVQRTGGK